MINIAKISEPQVIHYEPKKDFIFDRLNVQKYTPLFPWGLQVYDQRCLFRIVAEESLTVRALVLCAHTVVHTEGDEAAS